MKKPSMLPSLLACAALFLPSAGCATADRGGQNAFGLVESRPAHFAPPGNTTFALSTKELSSRENVTGRETRLLWGLLTITDY